MESMSELPLILIESNILPRLPAKSVGRCMCVCKQWKSFLSTPMFARIHLHNITINDYKLLLLEGQPPVTSFRTVDHGSTTISCCKANPDPSAQFILSSLDGLVCLASKERCCELAFWNPLTGAYRKLSSGPNFDFIMVSSLGAIGFYTDSSNDYKLLCVVLGGLLGAFIYSNRLDSWRKIKFSFHSRVRPIWSLATFFGDCLYFVVTSTCYQIICFDVNKETFRKIRVPPYPVDRSQSASLAVLNGCIHLCISFTSTTSTHVTLWRMDDGADYGWVEVASYYTCRRRRHICTTSTSNWLAVLEENKYSFDKRTTDDFIRDGAYFCDQSWEYRSNRIMYVETLVSPNP